MIVATIFHGTMVSVITQFTAGIFADKVSRRVAEVRRFLLLHGVSRELRGYIEDNLRRRMRIEQQTMSRDLLAKLSPSLQRELSLALLRDVILHFPLFRKAPRGFIVEMARAHIMVQCLPGEVIVEDGQVLKELVFVMRGRLVACSDPLMSNMTIVHKRSQPRAPGLHRDIEAGAWFGEESLFVVPEGGYYSEGEPVHRCNAMHSESSSAEDDSPGLDADGAGQMRSEGMMRSEGSILGTSACRTSARQSYTHARERPTEWRLSRAQHGTICSFELAELAVLPASEYWRVCRDFPISLRRHQKVCSALRTGKIRLDAFAHVPSSV